MVDGLFDVGGTEGKNPPFLAVLINFGIFIGLLVWKAGPPLRSYLTRRHDDVKGALEEAARMKREAEELLADRKAKLGAVDREVDDLIDGMKADAASEKKRMVEDAETAAAALKRDANQRIAAGVARARGAIEAEVVAAAIDAAEGLLREASTDDDHNALVESFIESLTNGTFGGGSAPPPPTGPDAPEAVDEGWS
jgi:F-type H+-transporting ATPase subunit b